MIEQGSHHWFQWLSYAFCFGVLNNIRHVPAKLFSVIQVTVIFFRA